MFLPEKLVSKVVLPVGLKELLEERIDEIERLIKKVGDLLLNAGGETLITKKENGKRRYYKCSRKGKMIYLGAGKDEEIRALENRAYWRKLVKSAKEEKKCLEKMEKILNGMPRWQKVFYAIPQERRHLIEPLSINLNYFSEKDLQIWKMNRFKNRNDRPSANVTMNGENVRSKSELIIADRLRCAGVPYQYESGKYIADGESGRYMKWHPDFRVLNQRTGREYWWEHFGRMGDPDYFAMSMYKLETYAKNGIYLGDNLIITMESDGVALGSGYVDMLIERFFK